MIRLSEATPAPAVLEQLERWQAEVDALPSYPERVEAAERHFKQRNTARNSTFDEVRRALRSLCGGTRRCGYCETLGASEIDHIWPKGLYPEWVFAWHNYLNACGPCNRAKGDRFAISPEGSQVLLDVSRKRGASIDPPPRGAAVLIDPRREDPMALLQIDLQGTFYFTPSAPPGTREHERAWYTLSLLKLNERDLPNARAGAFASYRALLREYIQLRDQGAPHEDLERRIQFIRQAQHPTVWREMQRQSPFLPELKSLFERAPAALGW